MSVRGVLAAVFSAILLLIVVRVASFDTAFARVQQDAQSAIREALADEDAVARTIALVDDLEGGSRGFALTREPAAREPYDRANAVRTTVLSNLLARVASIPDARATALDIARAIAEWDVKVATVKLTGDPPPSEALRLESKTRIDAIRRSIASVREALAREHDLRLARLVESQRSTTFRYHLSAALLVLVLVAVFVFVRRSIEQPLAELARYARSGGDTAPPRLTGAREVVDLGAALATMRENLEERRAHLETILGALGEGVFVFDRALTVRTTNAAAREILGRDVVGLKGSELRALLATEVLEGRPAVGVQVTKSVTRITDGSGRTRVLGVNTVPLPDPPGGVVASARDITEEHALRERLAAQNAELLHAMEAKTQFLATMSHELRTPLNAVIGFSEMLKDGTYGALNDRQRVVLEDVHGAGRHLLTLIDDLLDLAKIDAGQLSVGSVSFDIAELIHEAATMLARSAELKSIRLDLGDTQSCYARGDRARVRQVLLNLLSNAIKFTDEKGEVRVRTELRGDRVRVEVRDTGIGIQPEDAGKLFRPFSQVESGARRRYGGSGLGLSISKRLVEAMGGIIGFDSEPDRGSTFYLELPEGEPAAPASTARRHATPPPAEPPPVLVVEDEPNDASIIEALLTSAGYAPRVVRDAELALEAIHEMRTALIVVDLALPGMSGFGLIDRLRAHPRYRDVPIAVLTGLDVSGDERTRLEERVQLVVRKGTEPWADFVTRLGSLVAPAGAPRKLVLVVDDNEVNRRVARAMCEVLGYRTIEASGGEEALRIAEAESPDVILMDIEMPGVDGVRATGALRESPRTARIPVIALTAHAMAGDAERFLAAGCVAYVAKPMGRASLGEALARALDAARKLR